MAASTIQVFFYGLFMDASLLASKGIHPVEPAVGYVDGFRLHIGERATLLAEDRSRAYGVLMLLTPDEIERLYSEPGVADYVAEPVLVTLPGNVTTSAVCYNLPAEKLTGTNPEYAAKLLTLATRLGLPESYLRQIRNAMAAA